MTIFNGTRLSRRPRGVPALFIQKSRQIRMNKEAAKVFLDARATHLLLDWQPESRTLVLLGRPDEGDRRSFKIGYRGGGSGGALFSAKAFLTYIGWPRGSAVQLPVHGVGTGSIETTIPSPEGAKAKVT
jgi:hypothetical protein